MHLKFQQDGTPNCTGTGTLCTHTTLCMYQWAARVHVTVLPHTVQSYVIHVCTVSIIIHVNIKIKIHYLQVLSQLYTGTCM